MLSLSGFVLTDKPLIPISPPSPSSCAPVPSSSSSSSVDDVPFESGSDPLSGGLRVESLRRFNRRHGESHLSVRGEREGFEREASGSRLSLRHLCNASLIRLQVRYYIFGVCRLGTGKAQLNASRFCSSLASEERRISKASPPPP